MKEINKRVIRKSKKGNRKAFCQLIDLYKQDVYQICVVGMGDKYAAKAVAEKFFLYVYTDIGSFHTGKSFHYRSTVLL